MTETIFSRNLTKHFGGLAAVGNVTLEVSLGELHAIIGPNGAGKSTLINLLSGELRASSGQIIFQGRDIGSSPGKTIASRYRPQLSKDQHIFEFHRAGELPLGGAIPRSTTVSLATRRAELRIDDAKARQALAAVDLTERANDLALTLSHGEQRQLEIAMCLATEPQLLLLDEPLAGMGTEESIKMVELIKQLAATHAVLLVEHDMDAVFQLAQRLTVMVDGTFARLGHARTDPH